MRTIIPSLRKNLVFQILILAFLMPGLSLFPVSVQANPRGAKVTAGNVNIRGLGTSRVNINQSSNRAVINWQSFSIQNGEVTNFRQPGRNSVALNRVVTGNPSAIYGQLKSNGGVILINPNGIVVGPGGSVDVAGLLTMSTLDTNDGDFLNGGSIRYKGNSGAGVTNYGAISSSNGDVVLLGNFLQNYGTVNAPDGNVAFGAGGDIIVDQTASGGMISVLAGGPGGATGIENYGEINGAAAELKAHGNVYALAIKNDGVVRASGYNFKGGKLTLSAGSRGSIVNTGQLVARNSDGSGGQVDVRGGRVSLGGGTIDASGAAGKSGGSVNVSGREVLITDTTSINASGSVGGSVTVSGDSLSSVDGAINVSGSVGSGGSFDVSANEVTVGSNSRIDASGVTGGGSVRIGGGFQGNDSDIRNSQSTTVERGSLVLADAAAGNAGKVIFWSDGDTMFAGQVSAQALGNVGNGGFVEVSGAQNLRYLGNVSTAAANGETGTLLLDPTDVIVGPNVGATITDEDLVRAVLQNNVVIHTASAGTATGNITIQSGSNVVYDSANSLSFFAHGSVFVSGDIKNHGTTDAGGTGHITLVAGWDGTNAAAFGFDPDNPGSGATGPNVAAQDVIDGTYGAWGTNEGSVFINDAGTEPVEVGSARGETNAFGYDVVVRAGPANERFAQFGFRRENDIRGVALKDDGGVAATFVGTVAGLGTSVTITADNPGVGTIQLIGDGVKTLDVLISDWNIANPLNTITRDAGSDGSQIVANYTPITFSNTTNTALDIDFVDGVTGDINVHAKQDVLLLPATNNSAEEGFKNNDRSYVMIGHGGQREQDDGHENRGGTDYGSDSGHISVGNGNNGGNITVMAGRTVTLRSNRAESFSKIGHGGMGHDDPDRAATVGFAPSHTFNPSTYYGGLGVTGAPGVGTESRRSIWGDLSGDITIDAGLIEMEAGSYNAAYTQIGHGGERIRGSHIGDIDIITRVGGIKVEAAPQSAVGGPANSNDWRWRSNRDQSHAQIGHGGFDSDYTDNMQLPRRTVDLNTGDPDGTGPLVAGINSVTNSSVAGDGIRINLITGRAFGHGGDISVTSALGIEFRAGNGTDAYAMLGHGGRSTHGDHFGDVTVDAQNGDIIFDRDADQVNERGRDITNRGQRAHVQIGHGGGRYQGGSTGDIDVRATGNVEFYAGRAESFAMIGHGGRGEDASTWRGGRQRNNQANGTHSGSVSVIAGGDIKFRSGFSNRSMAFSQIGHGGYFQQADVLDPGGLLNGPLIGGGATAPDQQGHNGAILVDAGGDISFKAGADDLREGQTFFEANGYDNWTQLGHGGRHSKGDHHGTIDVEAGGDIVFEARGGWDDVTIENNNGDNNTNRLGTPRLNSTEDNGRNGYRNWAILGHGGYDVTHNNENATQNWNNSGKEGDGLGIDYGSGESHINITAEGDLTFLGAMEATAGPPIPIRIFEDNGAGNPNIGFVDNTYLARDSIFAGLSDGLATGVVVVADDFNDGGTLDLVHIIGDGATDLTTLVANWNANIGTSEPTVTLHPSSDGSQILADGAIIAVTPYATYNGNPTGSSEDVLIRAGTLGNGGPITLTGNGTLTLTELVSAWNNDNSGNQVVLEFGNGGDVIGDGETMVISGGAGARPTPGQNYSQHYGRLQTIVRDDGEVWTLPDPVLSAEYSYAQIGHGGIIADYRGGIDGNGHRGNISLNIGGDITVQAGDIEPAVAVGQFVEIQVENFQDTVGFGTQYGAGTHQVGPGMTGGFIAGDNSQDDQSQSIRSYAQIGHGGYGARGDHMGDITITGQGSLKVIGGEGREDYGQIGHGGVEADGQNSDNDRNGDLGNRGTITIDVAGSAEVLGGGRDGNVVGARGSDPATALAGNDDMARGSYGQIGHGGFLNGGSHSGDISLRAGGNIDIIAGTSPRGAYGMVGNGGYWARAEAFSGNISVISTGGDILVEGGSSIVDTETQTNGLDNTGQISSGRESFAMIGNGGFDADAQGTNQNNGPGTGGHFGDITVIASTGSVIVAGGGDPDISTRNDDNYRGLSAQIGNGGSFTDGDHTGNIRVAAGRDIIVDGGSGSREAFGQIGHGGYDSDGNQVGTIDLDAGRSVILRRGDGLNNPWSKVGHGGQAYGSRTNNGAGTREGDITVSAGYHFNSMSALVGHVDSKNDGDLFAYKAGNTYIAVSRVDPFAGGPGNFITDSETVITSAGFGAGSELRLYLPDSSANMIADDTHLNNTEYTRTPAPGSNRADETQAVEHAFVVGTEGEPQGDFGNPTPIGDYPTHNFGLYNIYYAGDAPPEVPVDPTDPGTEIGPDAFPFLNFAFFEKFDAYDRLYEELYYDGYEGQLLLIGLDDAVDGEDEEDRRRRRRGKARVGMAGATYYVFDPGTNKYSSYYVFGYPQEDLSTAR